MKYSIFGFSQEYAIKLKKEQDGKVKKLDATDLLILRDVADFMNRSKIIKYTIDDKVYFSIQYATILEDLPILGIKKQALSDRLDKMVFLNVLEKIVVKNQSGTFIAFRMGEEYEKLLYSCTNTQTIPTSSKLQVQVYSTTNHNTKITNNTTTKEEIERNQKKDEDELFLKFEEFAKEYKTLCGKHTVSGIKTLYEDFKKRHKDWQDVIPLLLPALKMEHQARTNANARNEFYPMPKNLSTYLGKQRAWEVWMDDIATYNEKEYRPICDGTNIFWNEITKCYITPFDIDSLADGYNETNRPDGAVVMWRGYKYNWNGSTKKWIKQ